MEGWCTPDKGRRMAELAYGAHVCVELGVFGGRSLVATALALQDQGYGMVVGVDPYTKDAALEGSNSPANDQWWASVDLEKIFEGACQTVERLNLIPYVRIERARSEQIVSKFRDGIVCYLHQDGNHSAEVSCQEVLHWAPKIKKGGLWLFDDAGWETLQPAQGLLTDKGFTLKEHHDATDERSAWRVYVAP